MPEQPSIALPNPHSPYADADPLYRHLVTVFLPSIFGEPKPGTLTITCCERLAVVPDEPLTVADEPGQKLPAGLCPLCVAVMDGEQPAPRYPSGPCQRCEVLTAHNGLCAQCRQEQHADWWQASDTWARPFRLVLPGKRVLDGAVFPNGQAVVIDDPEAGLSSGAASLEQLVAGYHRAEVMLAEDVIRVGAARVAHAVGMYAQTAIELEDGRRDFAELRKAMVDESEATQAALSRAEGSIARVHSLLDESWLAAPHGADEHDHVCPDDVRKAVADALDGPSQPVSTGETEPSDG